MNIGVSRDHKTEWMGDLLDAWRWDMSSDFSYWSYEFVFWIKSFNFIWLSICTHYLHNFFFFYLTHLGKCDYTFIFLIMILHYLRKVNCLFVKDWLLMVCILFLIILIYIANNYVFGPTSSSLSLKREVLSTNQSYLWH